jgi:hypothetical protein
VGQGSTFRLQLPAKADSRALRLVDQEMPLEPTKERDAQRTAGSEPERRPTIARGARQ